VAQRVGRGVALLFHDHGTRRGWGVSVTPRPYFTPGKDPVPIVQEAGWAPGPVWTRAENLASTGNRSPDCPARSQSLYRLGYPAHWPQMCLILGNYLITVSFTLPRSFQTQVTLYQSTRRNMRRACIFSKKVVRIPILAYLAWPFKWCSRILRMSWRSATGLVHTTSFTQYHKNMSREVNSGERCDQATSTSRTIQRPG
jgi:hypothetical protein